MKPAASGRILFWRHGSLWIGLAGEPTGLHTHHAVQISLSLPGCRLRLQRPSESWTNFEAAIVAANQPHAFEARGQRIAQIFLDPESAAGRALQLRHREKGMDALDAAVLQPLTAQLADAYERRGADSELIALAQAVVTTLAGVSPKPAKPTDARIARALDVMRERLEKSVSLAAIAAAVHLSPDRFRHLFMQETGVGFRVYLLWLRLECALAAYVAGNTLTDAAYAGGFADAAHFSRTFRRMFGIAPASVRPE
jgi:transcriptional regulator GlxA family with amidase domain